jgi:hypothetical protein
MEQDIIVKREEKRVSDEKAKTFLALLNNKLEMLTGNIEKIKETLDPSIVDRIIKLYEDTQTGSEKERSQIELDALIAQLKNDFPEKLKTIDELTKNVAELYKTKINRDIQKAKNDAEAQTALPEGAAMKEGEGTGGSTIRKRPRKKTRRVKR